MMKKLILIIFLFTLRVYAVRAQQTATIILNATLHLGNGQVIENGVLTMENGKIVDVGQTMSVVFKNAKTIDAKGKHVYPGLICMNNIMGLNEVDEIRATRDFSENGRINPNVRSLIAYNTDSKILPTAVVTGILYTQPVPQGGVISGTSSLMRTKAWNWEDAVVKADEGVHLNWPHIPLLKPDEENRAEKTIEEIKIFFAEANQYNQQIKPVFNARLDAMKGVFNGEKNLYVHANDARSLVRAINFIKKDYPKIKMVLVGAQEAYLVSDLIKENNIPVVLGRIHRLPSRNAEAVDQPYQTPAQLMKAGITVALSYEGSWEARNLAYLAGTAAVYGMGKEEALKSITLIPAQIMGVANRIGSLEKGKDASIVISDGDLLDMKSSSLFKAYLDGVELDLNNEQVRLYEKYKHKYGLD